MAGEGAARETGRGDVVTRSIGAEVEGGGEGQETGQAKFAAGHNTLPPFASLAAKSPQRPLPLAAMDGGHSNSNTLSSGTTTSQGMTIPLSPGRLRSASPGLHSPASSLIFERNVQEQTVPEDLSHKLPAHMQTEDHIPPVLEASSIAITDDHLNPDDVEILTHSVHQPAAVTVGGGGGGSGVDSGAISPLEGTASPHLPLPVSLPLEVEEKESTYGSINPNDVRRLSFISFADVVQSEHAENNSLRDGVQHMSLSDSTAANRSPSPAPRSPASAHFGGPSPPTSESQSLHGMDSVGMSKLHNVPGSPLSFGQQSPPLGVPASSSGSGGEVMVERMSEALRKTGSGDLLTGSVGHSVGSAAAGDSLATSPAAK